MNHERDRQEERPLHNERQMQHERNESCDNEMERMRC